MISSELKKCAKSIKRAADLLDTDKMIGRLEKTVKNSFCSILEDQAKLCLEEDEDMSLKEFIKHVKKLDKISTPKVKKNKGKTSMKPSDNHAGENYCQAVYGEKAKNAGLYCNKTGLFHSDVNGYYCGIHIKSARKNLSKNGSSPKETNGNKKKTYNYEEYDDGDDFMDD